MSNQDQIEYWNGDAGTKWSSSADTLDAMLAPFAEAVLDAAEITGSECVIDVGCGAGALSLVAAEKTTGRVVGVDVSHQLLETARNRAVAMSLDVDFIEADASTWVADTPFDVLISRFGVMFFDDPASAFANLRKSMKSGGRLAFACWQPLQSNEWVTLSLQAAMPFFNDAPTPPPPGTPGPFAFGDEAHVRNVLTTGGWTNVDLLSWTGRIAMPGATAEETAAFMLEIGPTARMIKEQELDAAQILGAITERLKTAPTSSGRISLGASVWIVTATA